MKRYKLIIASSVLIGLSCSGQDLADRNDLEAMQTDRITIQGTVFQVWLASTSEERARGLMQVPEEALAAIPPDEAAGLPDGAQRGMLFVFSDEELLSFWMLNTITALDIAYIRSDGVIVSMHTMAPLETRQYPSIEPAQFALEVRAGLLGELGIQVGDQVEIPSSVLKVVE